MNQESYDKSSFLQREKQAQQLNEQMLLGEKSDQVRVFSLYDKTTQSRKLMRNLKNTKNNRGGKSLKSGGENSSTKHDAESSIKFTEKKFAVDSLKSANFENADRL